MVMNISYRRGDVNMFLVDKKYKHKCLECNGECDEQKKIENVSASKGDSKKYFCSTNCCYNYVQRLIDMLETEHNIKFEFYDEGLEEREEKEARKKESIENEKQSSYDKGYDEGFQYGYLEAIKSVKLCPVCGQKIIESLHHIRPRKYGGLTTVQNIIGLCNKCHDKVECDTEQVIQLWLKQSKEISIALLKHYILNGFPSLEEDD